MASRLEQQQQQQQPINGFCSSFVSFCCFLVANVDNKCLNVSLGFGVLRFVWIIKFGILCFHFSSSPFCGLVGEIK